MVKTIIALMLTMLNTINVAPSEKAGNTQHYEDVRPIHIACGEGYEYECVENGSSIAIEASYPVVMLRYDDENNFSKLNKALADNNKSTKEYQLKFIKDNLEFARESYDCYDEYYHPFESRVKPLIRRGDTVVTSILYSGFTYMGGMNGDSYYYGENYDTQTGKELNLFDVVNDRSSLSYALREQLEDIADSNVNLDEVINAEKEYSWTLDYNGITFYFMPYAISPIATDVVVVTLSNKEYPEVLKNEYKVAPKAYGVELNPDVPFFYDVNGDGILDEIRSGGYSTDYKQLGCINLSVNGESITHEEWFFDYDATFVHNSDGRNYIYYEILREENFRENVCFDVTAGVKKIGRYGGGLVTTYQSGDEYFELQDALTDPENFYLGRVTHTLSSVYGWKKYCIGTNGLPVTGDTMITFNTENMITFTLLRDMEFDVYDEKQASIIGKRTLKAGEKVIYYTTDGEKYALLKCQDGTLCRVEGGFDSQNFYYTVNGIKLESVFDGIFFAG